MNTLRDRTKSFAVRIVRLFSALPNTDVARTLGRQLLRSGTSVGAHCREGHRSRSNAELISKYECALQELDETTYWLELLIDSEIMPSARLEPMLNEADELTRILVASVKTIKRRTRR